MKYKKRFKKSIRKYRKRRSVRKYRISRYLKPDGKYIEKAINKVDVILSTGTRSRTIRIHHN